MPHRRRPVRALRPGQRERQGPRRGDRARREPDPDDPHEPALQRLDPPAPAERPRVAEAGAVAGEPARVGRAVGAGRGGPARQDPGRGTEAPRPRRPPRRSPRVRLRPPAPQRRHVRRRPPPQAPRQPVRSLGPQGPARRRDVGGAGAGAGRRASRSTTTRSRRSSRPSARARRPVAIDRARIDRQIRELALEHAAGSLGDDAYLARLKALREAAGRDRGAARRPASRQSGRSSGCVPSPSRSSRQTYRRRGQT